MLAAEHRDETRVGGLGEAGPGDAEAAAKTRGRALTRGATVGLGAAVLVVLIAAGVELAGFANGCGPLLLLRVIGIVLLPGWAIAAGLALLTRRRTTSAKDGGALAGTAVFFVAVVAGTPVATQARLTSLRSVAERVTHVPDAVIAYQTDHGRLPHALEALVPNYLDQVPETENGACPDLGYERRGELPQRRQTFHVYVRCPGFLDDDALVWDSRGPQRGRAVADGWVYVAH